MKLNWGTGIAIVYSIFAISMIAVVFLARQHDPGLVRTDYYNLDLNYQEHLEKKQNAAKLPQGLQVQYVRDRQVIRLQFPAGLGTPSGSIKCYRPATVKDDLNLQITADSAGVMEVPATQLAKGLWRVEADWQANGTKYFNEAVLTLIPA